MLKKIKHWKKLMLWIIDFGGLVAGFFILRLILYSDHLFSKVLLIPLCYLFGFGWGLFMGPLRNPNISFISIFTKNNFQPKFLACIVPKKYRDEFFGDLLEQRFIMKEENQPNWYINLVSCGQIFFVVVAMLRVRLCDWLDPEKEKNK